MNKISKIIGACAVLAAGVVIPSFGQIQTAGTLLVNVDATTQPVGAIAYLTNNGAAAGAFVPGGLTGISAPQIVALGGNGTHGILLDGNAGYLAHYTAGTGGVIQNAPAGVVGANPDFSVEAWVYKATVNDETGPVCWGTRTTGQNVSCNWGRNTGWGGFSWQGGGYDHSWANVPTAGTWHHLVWTYDAIATGGGVGTVRLYRDGVLDKAEVQVNSPTVASGYNILIGAQHSGGTGPGFGYAAGVIGKVRVHDGVLSLSQITNNYLYEVSSFTNGTPAALLTTGPIHRYSFNLPPTNNAIGLSVPDTGSSNGPAAIIRGSNSLVSASWPYFDGTQLVLPNYGNNSAATNGYVDLPNGILSSLSSSNGGPGAVSLELWVQPTATTGYTWAEILYMGNASNGEITGTGTASGGGVAGIIIPSNVGGNYEQSGFRSVSIGNYTVGAYLYGSRRHIVVTWNEASNEVDVYHEGILVGRFAVTGKMNSIVDVNNWLGRSGYNDAGFPANYREFRMYNRILSAAEIRHNYLDGPSDVASGDMLTWNGTTDGNWNTTTTNWLSGAISTNFTTGNAVLMNDSATGPTTISLAATLSPSSVTVDNLALSYTIGGSGNISGSASLTKVGNGTLTFTGPQTNDYTGPNLLLGGKVVVTNLANGGLPSALGASSADPTNLVLRGGTLSYQGPAVTINRGYAASEVVSTIDVQNALNIGGQVKAFPNGAQVKTGSGTLTYSTAGSNMLSAGTFPGYQVLQGKVVFEGGGTQTSRSMSEFWVGSGTNYGADLVLNNSTLYLDSWLGVGRGNGNIGNTSTITLSNSTVITAANGLSGGYANGLPNLSSQIVTLNGSSAMKLAGVAEVGNSTGSSCTLLLNSNSWINLTAGGPRVGMNMNATGLVVLANSSALTNNQYTSIGLGSGNAGAGSGGIGRVIVKDNAVWNASVATADFNVTDLANSVGELDISNNAIVYVNGAIYLGKSAGTVGTVNQGGGSFLKTGGGDFLIGGNGTGATTSVGTYNLSAGTMTVNGNFQPGAYGQGTVNQSGGTVTIGAFPSIGRYAGSVGAVNVSGGTFAQTNNGTFLIVGEAGTGTLTVSGTGQVNSTRMCIGNGPGASGTVNLNGGTNSTRQVFLGNGAATGILYFNGGVLQAAAGASNNFMSGLSSAFVYAGGANIDSAGNDINIAQDISTDYTGGGLTKLGAGSLTLSGNLYYAGPTVVGSGTLYVTTHAYGGGAYQVTDGTTLNVQVLDYNGASVSASSLTVGTSTGATLTFNPGTFGNPSAAPLNVSAGTVTLNGTVTINIDPSSGLSVGEMPLVSYSTLTGSGTLALGTLPPGVFGYLTNDTSVSPSFIGLVVTSVFQPRWEGLAGGNWDIQVTTNWIDLISGNPQYFYQGTKAIFNDDALGTTNVNLVATVAPGGVLVSNSLLKYTISGSGRFTGSGGLTKLGSNTLTVGTTNNNYTGATLIDEGGTLVSTVANNLGTNSALTIGTGTLSLGANSQRFSSVTMSNGTIAASGATITASSYSFDNGSVTANLAGGPVTVSGTNLDLISVLGVNTYTGRTYLAGSKLSVTNLANGGLPSGIGASTANPTNLVFAGGGLDYRGPAVTVDRGYSSQNANSSISLSNNVTLTGAVTAGAAGDMTKLGAGQLAYTGTGSNVLTGSSSPGYIVNEGSVVFDGSNGGQTNTIGGSRLGVDGSNTVALVRLTNAVLNLGGNLDIGNEASTSGSMTVDGSILTVGSWLILGDGGSGTNTFTLNSGTVNNNNGALLLGGRADELLTVSINGGVYNKAGGTVHIADGNWNGAGARTGIFNQTAGMFNCSDEIDVGNNALGTGIFNLHGGTNSSTSWFVIGRSGANGTMTMDGGTLTHTSGGQPAFIVGSGAGNNSLSSVGVLNQSGGTLNCLSEYWVAENAGTVATNNISGTAVVNVNNWVSLGRGGHAVINFSGGSFTKTGSGQFIIGEGAGNCLWNQTGGTLNTGSELWIGQAAGTIGEFDLSAGAVTNNSWLAVGREGGQGTLNISGGTMVKNGGGNISITHGSGATGTVNQTGGTFICGSGDTWIGEDSGPGVWNISGGSATFGLVHLAQNSSATGELDLNGGSVSANEIASGSSGTTTVNFNGGTLVARIDNTNFIHGLSVANVQAGGAIIDTAGHTVSVNQVLLDSGGGLTKNGNGTLNLNGLNTYTSSTTVNAGLLGGTGTIAGAVVVNSGAGLAPGNSIGTLTVNGNLTLGAGSTNYFEVNGTTPANDRVAAGASVAYGGVLMIVPSGGFTVGQTFTLFSGAGAANASNFSSVQSSSPSVSFTFTNGVLTVATAGPSSPARLTNSVSGSTLTLTWPSGQSWRLVSQTNSLTTGLNTNSAAWSTVSGYTDGSYSISLNPANPTVFYKLVYP